MIWRRSTRCGGGECVEVAAGGRVHIRDGKDRAGPVLTFDRRDWQAFLAALR